MNEFENFPESCLFQSDFQFKNFLESPGAALINYRESDMHTAGIPVFQSDLQFENKNFVDVETSAMPLKTCSIHFSNLLRHFFGIITTQ